MDIHSAASASRAAALQAERERLTAKRARRNSTPDAPDVAAWRVLGVQPSDISDVRYVLRELLAVTGEVGSVRDCLDAPPSADLLRAVTGLLRTLPTGKGAEFLRDLQDMGLPLVDPQAMPAVHLLAQPAISAAEIQQARAVDAGSDWRLLIDVIGVSMGLKPEAPHIFVQEAPLAVVNDFWEMAGSEIGPDSLKNRTAEERRYLMARKWPERLNDQDVEALGWSEEVHRRRLEKGLGYGPDEDEEPIELFELISAAAHGDVAVLDRLEELLPPENAAVVHSVRHGAAETWSSDILEDRGLWNLLARHLPLETPIEPDKGSFFKWAAFRRAYELTKARRFSDAWAQAQLFTISGRPVAPLDKEVQNLRAYLTMLRSDRDAPKVLERVENLLMPMRGDRTVAANLKWLRARRKRTRNERGMPDNPYLVLGVDQGASGKEWKTAWRRLRRRYSGDVDAMSEINAAKDRIEALERAGSNGRAEIYSVPLNRKRLSPEIGRQWRLLVPGAAPLPWRKMESAQEDIEPLRARAFAAVLENTVQSAVKSN